MGRDATSQYGQQRLWHGVAKDKVMATKLALEVAAEEQKTSEHWRDGREHVFACIENDRREINRCALRTLRGQETLRNDLFISHSLRAHYTQQMKRRIVSELSRIQPVRMRLR